MFGKAKINPIIALLCWSALFVYSCGDAGKKTEKDNSPKPTMTSVNLTITNYENGEVKYRFEAPRMVRYENKDTAYMIFDQGVYIITYEDSTLEVKSWLKAKYAIYRESIGQWEARDSVVGSDKFGKRIYTDLLFWDQRTRMVNSPIHTRVVDGEESVTGKDGFKSDEDLVNIDFERSEGRILFDTTATTKNGTDTLPEVK